MIQVATLLEGVMSGLRDQYYPKGKAIYAVRDGEQFLYIGQTRKGVWRRIRFHICHAENALGLITRANWLQRAGEVGSIVFGRVSIRDPVERTFHARHFVSLECEMTS